MRCSILSLIVVGVLWGSAAPARTWHVPGDVPTIQAGIDSAAVSDTVLVAAGRYVGPGNTNLDFRGTDLVLLSEAGASETFIDCEDKRDTRGLQTVNGESSAAIVDGFTFEHGSMGVGAGISCAFSSPTVRNCVFRDNLATFQGGGFFCRDGSSPVVSHCVFVDNRAVWDGGGALTKTSSASFNDCVFENNEVLEEELSWGGGLHSYESTTTVSNCSFINNTADLGGGLFCILGPPTVVTGCTFTGNSARQGGGLLCGSPGPISIANCTFSGNIAFNIGAGISVLNHAELTMSNTIVTFSTDGEGVQSFGSATLLCCDLYGNAGGDWVGAIADQYGVDGNFSADPLFCDEGNRDFSLATNSPCLPGNHPDGYDCGQIGAMGQGCGTVGVDDPAPMPLSPVLSVSANPSSGSVRFRYHVSVREASMSIFDITGRLIRTFSVMSPTGTVFWDATSATGSPVANGTYFIRLEAGGRTESRRVVLLR